MKGKKMTYHKLPEGYSLQKGNNGSYRWLRLSTDVRGHAWSVWYPTEQQAIDAAHLNYTRLVIYTYNQARIKLYDMAREAGWDVSNPELKVPWFVTPKGVKVWLKKQSAYVGQTRPTLSTMYDIRNVHDFFEWIQEYPNH